MVFAYSVAQKDHIDAVECLLRPCLYYASMLPGNVGKQNKTIVSNERPLMFSVPAYVLLYVDIGNNVEPFKFQPVFEKER